MTLGSGLLRKKAMMWRIDEAFSSNNDRLLSSFSMLNLSGLFMMLLQSSSIIMHSSHSMMSLVASSVMVGVCAVTSADRSTLILCVDVEAL